MQFWNSLVCLKSIPSPDESKMFYWENRVRYLVSRKERGLFEYYVMSMDMFTKVTGDT